MGTGQILELLGAADLPARRTVAVGGGLHARLWPQAVSDVSGCEQVVPAVSVGACHGDALLAAAAAGLVPASTDWPRAAETLRPDPAAQARYAERSALDRDLYPRTREPSHALAGFALGERAPAVGAAAAQPVGSEHPPGRP